MKRLTRKKDKNKIKKSVVALSLLIVLLGVSEVNAETTQSSSTKSIDYIDNTNKNGQFGVGLVFGNTSGLDLEYWTASDQAMTGTIGFNDGNTEFSAAYLFFFRDAFAQNSNYVEASYFAPYLGFGALIGFGSNNDNFIRNSSNAAVAIQIPLGIEFLPARQRFSIFVEIAPSLEFTPQGYGFFTADLGAKFYF